MRRRCVGIIPHACLAMVAKNGVAKCIKIILCHHCIPEVEGGVLKLCWGNIDGMPNQTIQKVLQWKSSMLLEVLLHEVLGIFRKQSTCKWRLKNNVRRPPILLPPLASIWGLPKLRIKSIKRRCFSGGHWEFVNASRSFVVQSA